MLKVNGLTNETVILNAHADVVPADEEMFEAYEKDGIIFGRGACDDKGQIAAIYLLLAAIKKSGIKPAENASGPYCCRRGDWRKRDAGNDAGRASRKPCNNHGTDGFKNTDSQQGRVVV